MAGSLTHGLLSKGHRVLGASLRPPTRVIHYSSPFIATLAVALSPGIVNFSRKVQDQGVLDLFTHRLPSSFVTRRQSSETQAGRAGFGRFRVGIHVWPVKQSNNGTSWLCAARPYESPAFDNFPGVEWQLVKLDEPG
jgi:hypothetical protein